MIWGVGRLEGSSLSVGPSVRDWTGLRSRVTIDPAIIERLAVVNTLSLFSVCVGF